MSAGFGRGQFGIESGAGGNDHRFGQSSDRMSNDFQNMRVSADSNFSSSRNFDDSVKRNYSSNRYDNDNGSREDRGGWRGRSNFNDDAPKFGGESGRGNRGYRGGGGGYRGRGGFSGRGYDENEADNLSGGFGSQKTFDSSSRFGEQRGFKSDFDDDKRSGGFNANRRDDFGNNRGGGFRNQRYDEGDDHNRGQLHGERSFGESRGGRGRIYTGSDFKGGGFTGGDDHESSGGGWKNDHFKESRFDDTDSFGGRARQFGGRGGRGENFSDDRDDSRGGDNSNDFRGRGRSNDFGGRARSSGFGERSDDFSSRGRFNDFVDHSDNIGGRGRSTDFGRQSNGFTRQSPNDFGDDEPKRFTSFIPEDRPLEEMYLEDAENAKYEVSDLDLELTITGVPEKESFLRLSAWQDAGFSRTLLTNVVENSCYKNVRRIQSAIIPLVKNGWDICGHAETGSGKTAAFILPIIDHIANANYDKHISSPIALILAPTRELVAQIYNQARKFAMGTGVSVAKAYGQYRVMENINEIMRGCNILIATMGRLKDFVEKGKVKLSHLKFFVLDEADRMLSADSFMNEIMDLLSEPEFPTIENRQTLLFSATFDEDVRNLAKEILKNPHAFVSNGRTTAANSHVQQNFVKVPADRKMDELYKLLKANHEINGGIPRTLVFVERKKTADAVAIYLNDCNLPSSSTNGDRDQRQREEALRDFRNGKIRILVSTDVCARGIDVKDLEHVINYDLPKDAITYVHRIGRTGRLHSGRATTFIDVMGNVDRSLASDLVKVAEDVQQTVPQFLRDMAEGMGGLSGTSRFTSDDNQQNEGW